MSKKSLEFEDVTEKNNEYTDALFSLLDMYFENNKRVLVKHHIDSFNQFIEEIIPNILQNSENIICEKIYETRVIRYRLTFEDLGIKPPSLENEDQFMYPLDAIQKNLSYSSKYTATVTQYQDIIDIASGKTETRIIGEPERDVPIAKVPIMVGSKYCNLNLKPDINSNHCKYDIGGYFIVNGSEKVVLSVESLVHRKPLVFAKKDLNMLTYYVRVESKPVTQLVGNVQIFTIKMKKDGSIVLAVPFFKEISIFVLMRALGLESDADIINSIVDVDTETQMLNQLSIALNLSNSGPLKKEEAIETLINNTKFPKATTDTNAEIKKQQKEKHLAKILTQHILPHVTSGTDIAEIDMLHKAYYIGYMIHKLLKSYLRNDFATEEVKVVDDRDSMVNKRVETSGILLGTLFEQFFKKMLNDCNKIFKSKNVDDTKPPAIVSNIKPNSIEQGLRQALSTGNFGTQSRKGLSQMLNRMSHLHSLSYLRRIITLTTDASTNKMTGPRHLHNTQYGSMCPLETPEGETPDRSIFALVVPKALLVC